MAEPAVFMVHGLGGTQYDLGSMHKRLKNAGFVTHAITLPGHGGQPADLLGVRAEDWLEAVRAKYRELAARYEVLHVMGMCMGSLLAIETCKREGHTQGRLVALAPPVFLRRCSRRRAATWSAATSRRSTGAAFPTSPGTRAATTAVPASTAARRGWRGCRPAPWPRTACWRSRCTRAGCWRRAGSPTTRRWRTPTSSANPCPTDRARRKRPSRPPCCACTRCTSRAAWATWPRPARARWTWWAAPSGTPGPRAQAMGEYVALVQQLKAAQAQAATT